MPGRHLLRRQGEDHAVGVGQVDVSADLDEGDGGALDDGDAELVGHQAHDGRLADPRNLFELGAALRQRDEEEVAADVGAEDGKEVGAIELAGAEGLDGGGGLDAEAGIVVEEAVHGDDERKKQTWNDEDRDAQSQFAPGGSEPGGKQAVADGNTAAGAEKRFFRVVFRFGFRASRTERACFAVPDRRPTESVRRIIQKRDTTVVYAAFSHA